MTYTSPHYRYSATNPYYALWANIKQRCNNPKRKDYKNYGGRGIQLCERWNDFGAFIDDILGTIGPRPEGMSLDRIDNSGNYEPGNVKWSDTIHQNVNRRQENKHSKFRGVTLFKPTGKWMARGTGQKHLGYFTDEEEAARVVDRWNFEQKGPSYPGFNFPEEVKQWVH